MRMTPTRHKSCCFTGHRPEKLPWGKDESHPDAAALKVRLFDLAEAVYHAGITHFICGMARGADFYFCEAILSLREEHADVTLEAAIPCEEQAKHWSAQERNRYFHLVSQCDYETVLQSTYDPACMRQRNHYMVDHAAVLIAVYDGSIGGSMQTINYAKRSGLEILILHP